MKGINIAEISTMNIEELDNAIDYLMQEKKNLENFKKEELLNKIDILWSEAVKLGVTFYDCDGDAIYDVFDNIQYTY